MYRDMGMEHNQYQKNRWGTSPGKLRHSGMCDPIRVDLLKTGYEEYGLFFHMYGEASSEKLSLAFSLKNQNL